MTQRVAAVGLILLFFQITLSRRLSPPSLLAGEVDWACGHVHRGSLFL
jgi:hypothetical protein